jgi:hypothetical protein
VLDPTRFFRTVKVGESGSAVLFGTIAVTIGTWISTLFGALASGATFRMMSQILEQLPDHGMNEELLERIAAASTGAALVGQLIIAPIMALIGLFITAGVTHLFLLLVRGAPRGFDATLTTIGYALGIWVVAALPMCGGAIAPIWYLVLAIIGLGESHRSGPGKASFAVLAPFIFFCCCTCGLPFALVGLVKGGAPVEG